MKECFAITTYCNSDEKARILNETIDNLKQFNIDIIIHAHYPLNLDIQKKVNFYFYSSDNPILPRYNLYWYDFIKGFRLEYKHYDFAYTVMKQWKEIINIMHEYDVIHFLNYDANIIKELYQLTIDNILLENKSIFYENFVTPNLIQTIFFSILNKDFDYMISELDKDKYLSFLSPNHSAFLPSLEEFIKSILNDFKIISFRDYESYVDELLKNETNQVLFTGTNRQIKPYIKLESGYFYPQNIEKFLFTFKNDYSIFIGYYNTELTAIIFDLKNELKIEINDTKINIPQNTKYILFNLKDKIKINEEIIEDYTIKEFLKLECNIYNI